jgi:hypothetical protein
MGKFRCIIDPLIFPKARIFPNESPIVELASDSCAGVISEASGNRPQASPVPRPYHAGLRNARYTSRRLANQINSAGAEALAAGVRDVTYVL